MERTRGNLKDQIKDSANTSIAEKPPVEFISSGCIPLNLAASQKGREGGWARNRIANIVGDGSSGKTLLALELCADAHYFMSREITINFPAIKKMNIVYNNVEGVMDFPVADMYGKEFEDAVEWIQTPICQQFGRDYARRIDNLKKGEFLLYIVDSLDATISAEEKARIDASIKSDKEQEGSYKTEKAKYFSNSFFNDLCGRMKDKDATLICISQVRENLNAGMFGKKFYRTGGKALDFYTHQVAWLYSKERLKKTKNKKEKVYGVKSLAKFERNKVAKPFRDAEFTILFDYGIDNIESMISYLYGPKVKEIEWELQDGEKEYYKREEFINLIDNNDDYYEKLIDLVEADWFEIEEAIRTKRRKRF